MVPPEVATAGSQAPEAASAGSQLYGHLAQLLAPADSLEKTSSLVILEPAGRDVAPLAGLTGPAAAEALADFANAIPAAAASFLDTGTYYDDVWGFVLTSAVPTGPIGDPVRATVARVIDDNRFDFERMAQARFDVSADLYHPVRASPEDWLSADGWSKASFRFGGSDAEPAPEPPNLVIPREIPRLAWRKLGTLPESSQLTRRATGVRQVESAVTRPVTARLPAAVEPLRVRPPLHDPRFRKVVDAVRVNQRIEPADGIRWRHLFAATRLAERSGEVSEVRPSVSGFELAFEYRVVGLQRPWLQPHLFHLAGWIIPGLPPGGLSNGQPSDNPGLLPVLTTRMLVVRNLVVEARWSEADRAKAEEAGTIAFGPFTMTGEGGFDGARMFRPAPQVVAWLAQVVPACPAGA